MRTLVTLLALVVLTGPVIAQPDGRANLTPRLDKIQFLCTGDVARQCMARLRGCLGAPGTSPTTCCAAWTMCLNTYHCNSAGLHCRAE